MNLEKTLEKINHEREKVECCFTFCLWKDPTLYDDYKDIPEDSIQTDDAIFYYSLGKSMREHGYNKFDNLSVATFIADKPAIQQKFETYGGWHEVEQLMGLVSVDNVSSYYDEIAKRNSLSIICKKYEEIFNDVDRFKNSSNEDVYETFDLLNSTVSLNTSREASIENMVITDQDLEEFASGNAVGLNYGEFCPLLNYTTLGLPKGDIYLLSGHSGSGKSSFSFNNIAIPLNNQGIPVCILSNEMQIIAYKNMLLAHILVYDLKYWKLTRKKIKIGDFTDEDKEMLKQAQKISEEKYSNIYFIKLFDNDSNMIMKQMKRANRLYSCEAFIWDTFKSDDTTDEIWKQLLMSSRKIFNLVSKENWSLVCTFQLALYTTNQRYLDAGCLSSSKQIKEVVSESILCRKLWQDEYSGQKYDCKPFKFNKDNKKIKEMITLDPDKTYVVVFIDKTRNDENSKNILYQWDGAWNYWKEIGYCSILNDHKGN